MKEKKKPITTQQTQWERKGKIKHKHNNLNQDAENKIRVFY